MSKGKDKITFTFKVEQLDTCHVFTKTGCQGRKQEVNLCELYKEV